jgi:hypothetical protein
MLGCRSEFNVLIGTTGVEDLGACLRINQANEGLDEGVRVVPWLRWYKSEVHENEWS